ncbi:2-C-methyl-D-erythritol 4-phosphate cytidylyltransferase [Clostridium minihomine]|uniref:2-C-methyl-D-erythritol 4-phosphate cytidylyltransferase n=1 Tax=Clostridium minihomine TaxID=2045012 RepID=UPI000C778770|nr:2-C-methyl-D-erythritol 4-phosphate cytidylyltransferase [Clostridium minihomine]
MIILDRCCAIVVAAGSSSRMKSDISKIWYPLLGVPAIVRTLVAFEQANQVRDVVVVCRTQDLEALEQLRTEHSLKKLFRVVPGGETRQQSVACGIKAAPEGTRYFAIHDGARPLIRAEWIDQVVNDARIHGASALALPVRDTMKYVGDDGFVEHTPPRARLWSVQTPQVFERELYLAAMKSVQGDYTDDCQLIEKAGGKVHLCESSPENIKLTTPEDIIYAEAVLRCRKDGS